MSEEDEDVEVKLEDVKPSEVVYVKKIYGDQRIYCDTITLTECVQVICTRADQIKNGGIIYVTVANAHAHEVAIKEIIEGKCPLSILRFRGRVGDTEHVEVWEVNELKKSEKLVDKIQTVFDRSEKYNIKSILNKLRNK